MKIKNLIKELQKLNPEAEVIIASDSEGNTYKVLTEIYTSEGLKFEKRDGEINLMALEEAEEDEELGRIYKTMKDCFVLYP